MKARHRISVVLLSMLMLSGFGAAAHSASASQVHSPRIVRNAKTSARQAHKQVKKTSVVKIRKRANHRHHNNWFTDGLSKRQLRARSWVTRHESGHEWDILSYGHVCVGYFQLNPAYLGYKHGRVNLNHKHQVKVADAYVASRYGSWVHAKHFWQAHHWY